ncbi:hypothetical protein KM1_074980 [Entamoeba histolytica HM-3:IMSS]|uniref:Uncharacterized protein n=1 Tax=Entamoeba histolytica HM-3:IMSS TaxID=885315 RepID=M7X5S5_ENTHI|nr:hypothetical protein KM1_074980 [Entamoeba histolytica HM-3:IMSS]
MINILNFWL